MGFRADSAIYANDVAAQSNMTWEEVEKDADAGRTGFKTIKKLLSREDYNR